MADTRVSDARVPDARVYERPADVVTVAGPDAGSFLQSLLSQDLDPVAVGASVPALLLQPQGKLIAPMQAVRVTDDTWWLVTDAGGGAAVREGLHRFLIRVKAEIVDASDQFAVLAVRGDGARDLASSVTVDGVVPVAAEWRGAPAVDLVGARDAIAIARAQLLDSHGAPSAPDAYEAARIEAGVPRLGADVDERTIPQEAFLETRAVSFTKGCFVGQELVCRIDTRGHVNRYLRRLQLDGAAPREAEVVVGDRVVGHLTSVSGTTALAMVRHEVEPPATVTVRWPGAEVSAAVEAI
jgi:tRNA-modifying protein YgfZ